MRGSVRRRGPHSWELVIELGYDAAGKRQRQYESVRGTKREADRVLAARVNALATGVLISPAKLTVAEFGQRWLADTQANVALRTHERYAEIVRLHILPTIGTNRLNELRAAHVVRAQQVWRESGLAPRTVLKVHRLLHKMLNDAVRWGLVSVNVCTAVSAPRVERKEMPALTSAQARALLEQVRGTDYGALLATALYTGLRLGELRGLRWQDVDLDSSRLSVIQTVQRIAGELRVGGVKTHRSRRAMWVAPPLVAILREHRRRQAKAQLAAGDAWGEGGLVFTDALGRPVSDVAVRWAFWRALQTAGLPRVRLHDLRHTAATLLLELGVHPKIVSEMLGHSTIAVTLDLYSHVTPTMQREAAERLGALLSEPGHRGPF